MNRAVPSTLSVRVPFAVRKRGGRKLVITPDGTAGRPRPRVDGALVKALARAHRWQRMLESGEFATIKELAEAERIDASYFSRILRLTLLSPAMIEEALEGAQGLTLDLKNCAKPWPSRWDEQARLFGLAGRGK